MMRSFYWAMMPSYRRAFGAHQMLNCPMFLAPGRSLLEGQPGARAAKAFGRQVLRHYLRELAGDRCYVILSGTNPALGA